MQHPFLRNDFHIKWSTLTPDHIEVDISKALRHAQAAIDAVVQQRGPLTYANTIAALEAGMEPLRRAWGLVNHLDSVCNSPELRKAYNKMLPEVSQFFADFHLNEAVWKILKAYEVQREDLSPDKKRSIEETLTDFREAGADLPLGKKARIKEIQIQLAELTQKYSENCLDATHAWETIITQREQLEGLPQSALDHARQSAGEKGKEGWHFTLQAPSYISVMTYADNDALRRKLWQAYDSIGRDLSYDNREWVRRILDLRHELAQLLQEENFADHVTRRRMVGSGKAALEFIEKFFSKIQDSFEREIETLEQFKDKATCNGSSKRRYMARPSPLEPWEFAYRAEKQRQAKYDFDEEALRPYFPIDSVINGLFKIVRQIFGLNIVERSTYCKIPDVNQRKKENGSPADPASPESVEVWHEDVKFYDLFDAGSREHIGSFFTDWYPRESKRSGAWMNYLMTGNRDLSIGPHTPHLGLICGNLTPPVGEQPALLTHREVETIFHEFGHLLHHLCGEVEVKSLNGVNVAWDFVELPSQIMENWCWEPESLDLFAKHHETGEPIPEALFQKMSDARNYMKASANVRQLALAKMDLELHMNWPHSDKKDVDTFIEKALQGYSIPYKTKAKSNVFNFSHLFSSSIGYAAGYYSYKWAEVLDADAFSRFLENGVLNPQTGEDFRSKILAKGNSEDPGKLYKDFMNRAPDPDALLRRDGLIRLVEKVT